VKAIPTESPSAVRAFRAVVARAHAAYIAIGIKAAEDDAKAYREQAATAQARAAAAERHAAQLRRKFNAIR
jgi:hypothetical protein